MSGDGHMMNLAGPRPLGNSIESMDLGFSLQARCLEAVANGNVSASACVVPVPRSIDESVASAYVALTNARGVLASSSQVERAIADAAVCLVHERDEQVLVLRQVGLAEADPVLAPASVVVHDVESRRVELRLRLVGAFEPDLERSQSFCGRNETKLFERPSLARPM